MRAVCSEGQLSRVLYQRFFPALLGVATRTLHIQTRNSLWTSNCSVKGDFDINLWFSELRHSRLYLQILRTFYCWGVTISIVRRKPDADVGQGVFR